MAVHVAHQARLLKRLIELDILKVGVKKSLDKLTTDLQRLVQGDNTVNKESVVEELKKISNERAIHDIYEEGLESIISSKHVLSSSLHLINDEISSRVGKLIKGGQDESESALYEALVTFVRIFCEELIFYLGQ